MLRTSGQGGSRKRIAARQRKENAVFLGDGIGLAHKRQLRFHRAVCKTAISPERCIIAPFILKGAERCGFRAGRESSLQEPAQLPADGTQFSAAPSPDRW